jgi:hypothetical protein
MVVMPPPPQMMPMPVMMAVMATPPMVMPMTVFARWPAGGLRLADVGLGL